ncbi:helix-turn-helix transcriptional regulator [Kribbella sp. NPDC020789]
MESIDLFERLVAVVAGSLDEHPAPGAELAKRAGVSRFHFDRIAAAVAGETPSGLRRRLLMERAAYELAVSGRTILAVAVDAGFGSHEAFTRAFQRAYAVGPKDWRRQDSHAFFLDAPSGVHFHPPSGLRLPAHRKVTGMDVLSTMAEHHVWLLGEMIDRAGRLSTTALDQELAAPELDEPPVTPRRQLDRMVWQLDMWLAAVAGESFEFPAEGRRIELDELRRQYDVTGPRFTELVNDLSTNNRYDETFVDTTCAPPRVFSYGGLIAHILTFAAPRRALVLDALQRENIDDLGFGDPIHWVTDAPRR